MAQRLTREQFREWAGARSGRFEPVGGEPVAMSPERIQHARIKSRVWAALDQAIRSAGLACEALPDGVTIEVDADTDYEPDAIVNCGPPAPGDAVAATNPVVVVEVLSPGTQSVDPAEKLADYFRVPSVQQCLVVRATRREVIHHRRLGADFMTHVINLGYVALDPPGIAINVADIYPTELPG